MLLLLLRRRRGDSGRDPARPLEIPTPTSNGSCRLRSAVAASFIRRPLRPEAPAASVAAAADFRLVRRRRLPPLVAE